MAERWWKNYDPWMIAIGVCLIVFLFYLSPIYDIKYSEMILTFTLVAILLYTYFNHKILKTHTNLAISIQTHSKLRIQKYGKQKQRFIEIYFKNHKNMIIKFDSILTVLVRKKDGKYYKQTINYSDILLSNTSTKFMLSISEVINEAGYDNYEELAGSMGILEIPKDEYNKYFTLSTKLKASEINNSSNNVSISDINYYLDIMAEEVSKSVQYEVEESIVKK